MIQNDILIVAGNHDVEIINLQLLFQAMVAADGQGLPQWKTLQNLPRPMASMGAVAFAAPSGGGGGDNKSADQGSVTLVLANGVKENSVHALTVPDLKQIFQDDEQRVGNIVRGTWSELPRPKVPSWERDLVVVGDYLIAVGDTWIEGLQLTNANPEEYGLVVEPEDFPIPWKRVATWVYTNWGESLVSVPGHQTTAAGKTSWWRSSWKWMRDDPRLRNGLISIVVIWLLFFRGHQPPRQRMGQGRRLGQQ